VRQPRSAIAGRVAPVAAASAALIAIMATVDLALAAPLPATTGDFGLFPASHFRVVDGRCADCGLPPPARFYFEREPIAVPAPGWPVAGFSRGVTAFDDVRAWAAARSAGAPPDYPPLVWVAAPTILRGATLAPDGRTLATTDGPLAVAPVPKIPLNRSYWDGSTIAWLGAPGRRITVRGVAVGNSMVVRTAWPDDFTLGGIAPPLAPAAADSGAAGAESARSGGSDAEPSRTAPTRTPDGRQDSAHAKALRTLMRELPDGGARAPYAAMTLWQRPGASDDWTGRSVLAFVVDGAQGDDDEAHGGHFAIATGRIRADGAIGDWLVNNFYSLDIESEKGILAAPVPLDNYLGDLNSGQGWYRPSYIVVAVLNDARAAELVQSALGRVYHQFWRHQLVYYHPTDNCTSISIDTLRALGLRVPERGPTSRLAAWAGFPFHVVRDRSIAKAKLGFDYLVADQTRLMPAAALEEIYALLRGLGEARTTAAGDDAKEGTLATLLAADLDAIAFLRLPQFPSSRAFGAAPAVTTWEYRSRVPEDPALAQIVPVPPRPFPAALRDDDLLPAPPHPSDTAAMVWGVLSVIGLPWVVLSLWRRWRRRGSAHR
jgi:hypothetical protein